MSFRTPFLGGSSDASRPPSRATASAPRRSSNLAPASDQRLDTSTVTDGAPSRARSKKRSHDAYAMEDLLRPSIVVKPHPQNLTVQPRSLQPLMLLPREHLHLSFLDLHSPYGSFESSRYFESKIKILDLEGRVAARPIVLLARLESDKTVYAFERQENGLYTLCQLGSWVNLTRLSELATVARSDLITKRRTSAAESSPPQPLITPQLHKENKSRRLAIEAIQSLVKKPARSRSMSTAGQSDARPLTPAEEQSASQAGHTTSQEVARTEAPNVRTPDQLVAEPRPESPIQPTSTDIFDSIRTQYIETLYHSMGSLAYFAKGPLSRARAAFHLDCDSALEMNDLIDFLKSLVMNTVQIDKKYRETLPEIISKMNSVLQDSDNEQSGGKAKKRKVKKMKLGKNGLYPLEDEHVQRWWNVHKPQPKDDDDTMAASTGPHDVKIKLSYLRTRETQLQMIIILEILALEPLRIPDNAADPQLPGLPGVEADPGTTKHTPVKKRNRHNLPFLLDIHADRLCIWQSTSLDEVYMMDNPQVDHGADAQDSLRSTSDPLKDFCVDVIVPFFSARLPEQCDSINRKLGGPVMAEPTKTQPKKPESAIKPKPKPKPGSSAKRSVPAKSTKTLDTVLSKESEKHRRSMSRGPSGIIALLRSTTTPMLKREASEPLSIKSLSRPGTADTNEKSKPAVVPIRRRTADDKAKKEAVMQAELHDAINSLRRPNRDVVGKAMAEADERRATTSLSQLKKSKKPVQHHGVVKATPVASRFRDVPPRDAYSQPVTSAYVESIEADNVPSSSALIPSSAPRKRGREAAFATINESPALPTSRANVKSYVAATPRRPVPRQTAFLTPQQFKDDTVLASSPVAALKIAQPNFTKAPRRSLVPHDDSGIGLPSSLPSSPGSIGGSALADTPHKPRAVAKSVPEGCIASTPAKTRGVGSTGVSKPISSVSNVAAQKSTNPKGTAVEETARRPSIYERLGWDDDFDELG